MAGGYNSYRGRTPKGRIALAVLLMVVIVAALGSLVLQRYVIFDDMGNPRLQLPLRTEEGQEEPLPENVELTIQEPEKPAEEPAPVQPEPKREIYAVTAMIGLGKDGVQRSAEAALADTQRSAVAITVRDRAGYVYFDAVSALSNAVRKAGDEALRTLADSGTYTVARFACFRDNLASNADVEGRGLKNTGGYIFYDGNNCQWLDPAKADARAYLCALAQEAASLGVDEILLSDVSYPTEGKLNKIAYGDVDREAMLLTFLEELCAALEPYEVKVAVELPETVLDETAENPGALTLKGALKWVNRVYIPSPPERVAEIAEQVRSVNPEAVYIPVLPVGTQLPEDYAGSCLFYEP